MEYITYQLGTIRLIYMLDKESGHISMLLLPEGKEPVFEERREMFKCRDIKCRAWDVGSLCHLSLSHHPQGAGAGNTLKFGVSTELLRFKNQEKRQEGERTLIETTLESEENYQVKHTVAYTQGEKGIEVETVFINHTGEMVTLDLITSFSLDNLSPLQRDDAPYKLKLHRFRGGWSLEGKHTEETVEDLNLEGTWFRGSPESERYGVLGSFPVKRWFPFGCVEDTEHHVYWAAQTEGNSSWQMELTKDGDCYSLSGGIADREFGGWRKNIPDGGSFKAPKAYISVSDKDLWDVCQNITDLFRKKVDKQPEREQDLPLIFNEWCTSWGNPTHESMTAVSEKLKNLPFSYLVIDAGWSEKETEDHDPQGSNGEWICDRRKFPQGLLTLSREMKEKGQTLGIWMEFEVTTQGARVHSGIYDSMHLHRYGQVIQTGKTRRFWDFRKPEVIEYLQEKVIDFLRENEIGYLKVDYNGSIGSGCDGAESQGEGLREQMQAVYGFFVRMREALPELVIENCASGGHRLEPLMMGVTAMSSFSDAHECREIPYIAADIHQLIQPRQSQIWAVISPELSIREIQYRLVSAMLGRFCLSGEITKLNQEQWSQIEQAVWFYEEIKGIVKNGRSSLVRNSTENQHHLRGDQVLIRKSGNELLLVYHAFEDPQKKITGKLPGGKWTISRRFGAECEITVGDEYFEIIPGNSWEACAVHLVH